MQGFVLTAGTFYAFRVVETTVFNEVQGWILVACVFFLHFEVSALMSGSFWPQAFVFTFWVVKAAVLNEMQGFVFGAGAFTLTFGVS